VTTVEELIGSFDVAENLIESEIRPSYNVAPTHLLPIIGQGRPRVLSLAAWGFSAPWKGSSALVINARVETVFEKRTFRGHTAADRCVIPMSGYYEWLTNESTRTKLGVGKGKVPYCIRASDGSPIRHKRLIVAAGLRSNASEGSRCVMLTTAANESIESIHDRMPVLLDSDGLAEWLSERSVPSMDAVLQGSSYPLEFSRSSTRVNSVSNDDPSILEPDPPTTLF
jgi:putative SOS response-associated peptidase YedK